MTPTKRIASTSPHGSRPTKKLAVSSPEEGELDDATPLPPRSPRSPSPAKSTNFENKIPFPFKKKSVTSAGNSSNMKETTGKERVPAIYERSEEDERRIREADEQRRSTTTTTTTIRPNRWHAPSGGDHWEPGLNRHRRRDTYVPSDSRHRARKVSHTEHDTDRGNVREKDRSRSERRREGSSRADRRREGSPSRSSPSPSSHERSHSPVSLSATPKEKHRLPAPRSPIRESSPPVRQELGGRGWEERRSGHRDQDYVQGREYYPRDDERPYASEDRSYYSREWERDPRGHYRRTPPDDFDYRRERDPQELDWRYRDIPDVGRRKRYENDTHSREYDSYRPVSPIIPPQPTSPDLESPSLLPAESMTSPCPREPLLSTPPPPTSPPPPPPPPLERPKDETLPAGRMTISIALPMKKPGAPKDARSPPSMLLPANEDMDRVDSLEEREVQHRQQKMVDGQKAVIERKEVERKPKREPVHRTREQEKAAYGRVFVGCGSQVDYDVLTKLGEGTFGEVHKAIHTPTGSSVALKRILMHNEKEGMPVTALREIKILKALNHPCVIDIMDMFVVRSKGKDPLSVYMVFPYMDHDLAGLLENERVKLQPSQIKLYMKQLLEGTEYMHRNHILHRDMKAANLLISNTGSLRIADFGLARSYDPNIVRGGEHRLDRYGRERKYTNCVVTRWYRPPELLLGARQYGGEVDIWGIGCVLGEMFWRRPILPGTSDIDQLDKIWQLCGSPNQQNWPNWDHLPGIEGVKRFPPYSRRLKTVYETIGPETCDLLDKLLTLNPRERITAAEALDHDYFWTDPLPADPKTLPTYEASHEFDKRGRRNQAPAGPPPQMPPMEQQPRFGPPPPFNFNRGQPPREMFRTGPPPPPMSGYSHPPFQGHQGHPPPYPLPHGGYPPPPPHPFAWQQQQRMQYGGPPPQGQPFLPPGMRPDPSRSFRPPNLPPRPNIPIGPRGGRGGGRPPGQPFPPQRNGRPHNGELNYD